MDRSIVSDWRQDEVTLHLMSLLEEAKDITLTELLGFQPETPCLSDKYYYLKGKLEGIKLALEAELEEE